MTTSSRHAQTDTEEAVRTTRRGSARATALAALAVGAASSTAFALIAVLMTLSHTSSKDLTFHHAGDYWYTAVGIPTAISSIVLLFALRTLQPAARPQLVRAAVVINTAALSVLALMLAYSVATGSEARWGGTYIIATLATFLAHVLFSAASWRSGYIPRPLLTAWPLVWLIGAFAAQGASPLLLAAYYITLGAFIARRR
jgi:hypothetical protein